MIKKILLTLAFAIATFFPAVALADEQAYVKPLGTLLSAAAMDGLEATRTFTLSNNGAQGYSVFVGFVKFTRSAATRIDLTCYSSDDNFATQYNIQSCVEANGICTANDSAIVRKAVSASGNWSIRLDILGYRDLRCVVDSVSGGADDLVTVTGYLATN